MLRMIILSAVVTGLTIVPEKAYAAPTVCANDADCSALPNQKCNFGSNTCVTFAEQTDSNDNCLAEASSVKGVNGANCTANDISIAQVFNVTLDPSNPANPDQINACSLPTNTIAVTAEFEITANAANRYNVGIYFANAALLQHTPCNSNTQCGNDSSCSNGFCTVNALGSVCTSDSQCSSIPGSSCDTNSGFCRNGCAVSTLPASNSAANNVPGVGNFYNTNTDQCGDISSANPLFPYIHFTVPCSAVTASGILQLPYCTSWQQSVQTCQSPTDAVIGGPSKCNCNNGAPLSIQLPAGGITVIDNTVGGDNTFSFTSDVPGASAFSISTTNGTNSYALNALKGLQSYSITQGAQTLPWEFASVVCTSSLSDNPSTFTYSGQTATVFLQPKDAVTCTFTNTLFAYIPTVTNAQTPTTTGVGTGNLVDSATISGGLNPSGNVNFYLFDPAQTCSATPAAGSYRFTYQMPVNGEGTYSMPAGSGFQPDMAGTWQWIAVYSGDATNGYSSSGCGNAPVTVQASSTSSIAVSQNSATSVVGAGILVDSATLSGGFNPTGTVTFYLFDPAQTSSATPDPGSYRFAYQIPVNGDGTYSIPADSGFVPDKVGTWQWIAVYSGDTNNNGGYSGISSQLVTVISSGTNIVMSQAPAVDIVGGNLIDSATLTGGFNPTGTVTLYLFDPSQTCSSAPAVGSYRFSFQIPVNGNGTYSIPLGSGFQPDMVGTWQWIAVYGGDSNNNSSNSGCGSELVTVTSSLPTVGVSQTTTSSTVGSGELIDSLTISGGFNPTGTVQFYLFDPTETCSATPASGSYRYTYQMTVNGNGSYSIPAGSGFIPDMTGVWQWIAVYSGDANNNGSNSGCGGNFVTVTSTLPTVTVSQNTTSSIVGSGELLDSLTISGGYNPTGTITFYLFDPTETCSATPATGSYRYTYQVTVNGNGTYSIPAGSGFIPDMTGVWQWIAVYSGDANNNGSNSGCGGELVTVTAASSAAIGSQNPNSGTAGSGELLDSLTISGGYNPTGIITFYLFDPSEICSATPSGSYRYTYQLTVNGDGTYSIPAGSGFTPDLAGTWQWIAIYSGDANNAGVASACVSAQVSLPAIKPTTPITPINPTAGTTNTPSPSAGASGSTTGGGGCNAVWNSEPSNLLGTSLLLGFLMLVIGGLRRKSKL